MRSGIQPLHPVVRAHMHVHSGLCLVINPSLTSSHGPATKSTGESYSGREGVVVVPDERSVWPLPFPLLSAKYSSCFYRKQRQHTQFEFALSLFAQSCMLTLTSASPDACSPVPVDSIQERGASNSGASCTNAQNCTPSFLSPCSLDLSHPWVFKTRCGLSVCVPPKLICQNPNNNMMVLGGEAFGGD